MSRISRKTIWLPSGPAITERGSILPYVSVAAAVVAFVALSLMTGLGDAILHRRDASNAADAAALAAAHTWADSIESTYRNAASSGNERQFWGSIGHGAGSFAGPKAEQAAKYYATLNDAMVTSYSVDESRGTVTVSVRTNSTVSYTQDRATATSTAKVTFERGVCLKDGKVGYNIHGECSTNSHQQRQSASSNPPNPKRGTSTSPHPSSNNLHSLPKAKVSARLVN